MHERRRPCACMCDWATSLYSRKQTEPCKPATTEKLKIITNGKTNKQKKQGQMSYPKLGCQRERKYYEQRQWASSSLLFLTCLLPSLPSQRPGPWPPRSGPLTAPGATWRPLLSQPGQCLPHLQEVWLSVVQGCDAVL